MWMKTMLRILIVEDNAWNRDLLTQILQDGYEVLVAEDGVAGVKRAIEELPDLIVMDLSLPKLDGWKAAAQLRQNPLTKHIPIVAVTAHAMTDAMEKAAAVGIDAYMVKPIDERRLLATIEEQLENRLGSQT